MSTHRTGTLSLHYCNRPWNKIANICLCWCRLTGRHIQGGPFQCQWWFGRRRTQTDPSPPGSMMVDKIKNDSLTNRSIFLGVLDTVNADDMVRHLGLKLVPRTPIHVWLTTLKLVEEFTNNSNITFPLMLWRYKDTSSIIQRHIATVSNIDKASNPYISSVVYISNDMIKKINYVA